MNRSRKVRAGMAGLLWLLALKATPVLACAACAGKSDDLQAQGMNWGIYSLLGVVVMVLGGVGSFFIYLAKRAAATPVPFPETLPEPVNPARA